jgi:hypothetical protein
LLCELVRHARARELMAQTCHPCAPEPHHERIRPVPDANMPHACRELGLHKHVSTSVSRRRRRRSNTAHLRCELPVQINSLRENLSLQLLHPCTQAFRSCLLLRTTLCVVCYHVVCYHVVCYQPLHNPRKHQHSTTRHRHSVIKTDTSAYSDDGTLICDRTMPSGLSQILELHLRARDQQPLPYADTCCALTHAPSFTLNVEFFTQHQRMFHSTPAMACCHRVLTVVCYITLSSSSLQTQPLPLQLSHSALPPLLSLSNHIAHISSAHTLFLRFLS